jgi:hypothetical protein
MAEARVERRLAAILAADIAGYSRLMGVDEEGTLATLKAYQGELVYPKLAEHRGRVVKMVFWSNLLAQSTLYAARLTFNEQLPSAVSMCLMTVV